MSLYNLTRTSSLVYCDTLVFMKKYVEETMLLLALLNEVKDKRILLRRPNISQTQNQESMLKSHWKICKHWGNFIKRQIYGLQNNTVFLHSISFHTTKFYHELICINVNRKYVSEESMGITIMLHYFNDIIHIICTPGSHTRLGISAWLMCLFFGNLLRIK